MNHASGKIWGMIIVISGLFICFATCDSASDDHPGDPTPTEPIASATTGPTATPTPRIYLTTTPHWTQVMNANSPFKRAHVNMTYDNDREVVVLFGGSRSTTLFNETWEFDGHTWSQRTPAHNPPVRSAAGLCYFKSLRKCILFGGHGQNQTKPLNDTWSYDGTDWTELHPLVSPEGRSAFVMVYADHLDKIYLFSGWTPEFDEVTDFWSFDGTTWTKLDLPNGLYGRVNGGMCYDSRRRKIVLYGGNVGISHFNDLWEFDGAAWTKIQTSHHVNPFRFGFGFDYYEPLSTCILFGGGDPFTPPYFNNDTWAYDGTDWVQLNPPESPSARTWVGFTYMPKCLSIVLVDGYASPYPTDTWVFSAVETHAPALSLKGGLAMVLSISILIVLSLVYKYRRRKSVSPSPALSVKGSDFSVARP